MLRYDNLWQRDHSISAQFQVSPQDTGEVKMYALSYTLPAPWMPDHQIVVYGVKSDSNTAVFGQGLLINGKGSILGCATYPPCPLCRICPQPHRGASITRISRDSTGFITGAASHARSSMPPCPSPIIPPSPTPLA